MAKASKKSPEEKLRVVLSVLRGELPLSARFAERPNSAPAAGLTTLRLALESLTGPKPPST